MPLVCPTASHERFAAVSQIRMIPSLEPDAIRLQSGENEKELMYWFSFFKGLRCPKTTREFTCEGIAWPIRDKSGPDTRRLKSGENEKELWFRSFIELRCPKARCEFIGGGIV
jgi:hypothetical protein